jgi:hypothetical protein
LIRVKNDSRTGYGPFEKKGKAMARTCGDVNACGLFHGRSMHFIHIEFMDEIKTNKTAPTHMNKISKEWLQKSFPDVYVEIHELRNKSCVMGEGKKETPAGWCQQHPNNDNKNMATMQPTSFEYQPNLRVRLAVGHWPP